MVVVSGATCPSCDGCYNKSEKESNGKPVYINKHAKTMTIANSPKDDYWYIKIVISTHPHVGMVVYESMDIDGPQGKYESLFDDSIATVNCMSVCPYTLE